MSEILMLDPAKILADDNARFGLKKTQLDELKDSILDRGEVLVPLEVEPLSPKQGHYEYRLTAGFYRHEAVTQLNKEQNAGLQLPVVVRTPVDGTQRLLNQVTENARRQALTPMDTAVAIKKLMEANVSRSDIRKMFARTIGKETRPASNSWVNIMLRLLDLPKTVQEKIHDGRVSFAGAYELGKVAPDRRADVLARAESEIQKRVDEEEKDEQKYLAAEKKLHDAEETVAKAGSELDQARADVDAATKRIEETKEAYTELCKAPILQMEEKEQTQHKEKVKASQADMKAAEKLRKDAQNKVAKLLESQGKAKETVKEARERLEAARKAKPKTADKGRGKGTAVGPTDVKKAAAAAGAGGHVPLDYKELKMAIKDVEAASYKRVAAIGKLMGDLVGGALTTKMFIDEAALVTGERTTGPVKK